ncbi:MAG: phasin family protein [Alphaproteobacteria bacterium]|nr:phasin family protein [Alphaproteobacteria bacterium]
MSSDIFETLSQLTETTIDNYRKIGEANVKLGQKLLEEQADLVEALYAVTKERADKTAKSKDYQAASVAQFELAQEASQIVLDSCKSCGEYVAEAGKVYSQILESGVKAANANFAAKPAAKAAKSA